MNYWLEQANKCLEQALWDKENKQWLSVNQIDCESTKNLCWKLYEECIENWRMINAR